MECLADIKSLFSPTTCPFYAAFGNRDSVNTRFRPNFNEIATQFKQWCLSELSGCVRLQASWRSRVSDLHSESQRGADPGAGPRKQNNVSMEVLPTYRSYFEPFPPTTSVFISQIRPAERAGGACFSVTEFTAQRHLQLPRVQLLLFLETTHCSGVFRRADLGSNLNTLLKNVNEVSYFQAR